MYSQLKGLLQTIIPEKIWKTYESTFRGMVYWFYKGDKFQCNICEAPLNSFIQLDNKDLLCPRCGSLPRTRRLFQLLHKYQCLKGKLLHFSPPLNLYKKLAPDTSFEYLSSDFENEFLATHQFNLTNIDLADNTIDSFIAYHVLEHIEADTIAMKELYRIIKIGGQGLIQTPFKEGAIYEDVTIKSPKDRLLHFGQKDHVRIYSADGLAKRLANVGFNVEQLSFSAVADNKFGFKTNEIVLLVRK